MDLVDLTTDYNPGDKDPGVNYSHVRVLRLLWDDRDTERIQITWCYGTVSGGDFVIGKEQQSNFVVKGDDLNAYKSLLSTNGEAAFTANVRTAHQFLVDKGAAAGGVDGAVVSV